MIPYRRGDVVLVLFPHSDQRSAKRRPALVIQANNLGTGLQQIIVAMITSKAIRKGHPSRVEISVATPAGKQTGLRIDSVVMTDNIATIFESEIDRVLGFWADMSGVNAALRHTLAL